MFPYTDNVLLLIGGNVDDVGWRTEVELFVILLDEDTVVICTVDFAFVFSLTLFMIDMVLISTSSSAAAADKATEAGQDINIIMMVITTGIKIRARYDENKADELTSNITCLVTFTSGAILNLLSLLLLELIFRVF